MVGIAMALGWLFLCAIIIFKRIEEDFNIKFEIFSKIRQYFFENIFANIFNITSKIFMLLTFWAAYDSRQNIFQCIILIIVGLIFGITGRFFKRLLNGKSEKENKK